MGCGVVAPICKGSTDSEDWVDETMVGGERGAFEEPIDTRVLLLPSPTTFAWAVYTLRGITDSDRQDCLSS